MTRVIPLPDAFLSRPLAHRGLHDRAAGRIENAPASFAAAVEAGYGIELDLQLSADGVAMVFHDAQLDRLTRETGPVAARTAEELTRIALTDSSDTIPTLAQVLAQVAGQVPLLIELKDQDGAFGPDTGALEQATAAALRGYDGPVAVMSFNPHSVTAMARLSPDVPRGLTTCAFDGDEAERLSPARLSQLRRIASYEGSASSFVSHDSRDLTGRAVSRLRDEGQPILCWTIRSEAEARAVAGLADNITFEGFRPA
ncbi:MAG: glycerophosphodiester phosphodiesterase family protein [Celeribacter sp.]|jgi:glycerophosphoryl diester phosphodiesterase